MGKLIVKVHGCRDLKGSDLLSKADCYVKVTVGSKSFRTKTIDNDDNPNYNEAFSFFISDASIDESIQFELFDAGTFSDDLLGSIYIPIKSLHPNQENSLTMKWEKGAGSLICKIHPELGDAASAQMTGTVANNHGSVAPPGSSLYPQVDPNYAAPKQSTSPYVGGQQQPPAPQQYMPTGGPFGSNSNLNNSSSGGVPTGSPYGAVNQQPYSSPYGGGQVQQQQQQPQQQQSYPQALGFKTSPYESVGQTANYSNQVGFTFTSQALPPHQQAPLPLNSGSSGYPGYPGGTSSYPGAASGGGSAYPGYPGYKS